MATRLSRRTYTVGAVTLEEGIMARLATANDQSALLRAGLIRLPPAVHEIGTAELQKFYFSERDIAVLACLAKGRSNKVIAYELHIAESTVKHHIKRIKDKIHAKSRTQVALWGAFRGVRHKSPGSYVRLLNFGRAPLSLAPHGGGSTVLRVELRHLVLEIDQLLHADHERNMRVGDR